MAVATRVSTTAALRSTPARTACAPTGILPHRPSQSAAGRTHPCVNAYIKNTSYRVGSTASNASSSSNASRRERVAAFAASSRSASSARLSAADLMEMGKRHDVGMEPSLLHVPENRVLGCTSCTWLNVRLDDRGPGPRTVRVYADSDALLTRGLCALVSKELSGLTLDALVELSPEELLAQVGGWNAEPGEDQQGQAMSLTRSRTNGFLNMLESAKKQAYVLQGNVPTFPSLVVSRDATSAVGQFAETQAAFLQPDPAQVSALVELLSTKKIGIVAHFYMDPQVQGVLSAAKEQWPHVNISDSLVMADGAVAMADAGCETIAVLGVDFMSENVRAILDEAGYGGVAVYRMAAEDIGCSLAEAAESDAYMRYLEEAKGVANSLHVVYINTSLKTKAQADAVVPTITCTSSNVVQTVLQAFAQVPDAHVWYGPDTYMGGNLVQLFERLAEGSEEEVRALHPEHTPETIRALLPRLHYFQEGTCIVHHLFGGEVCRVAETVYRDAYIAAHFEVPGEMFGLAMEAKKRGMGVVGSTQNILDFIAEKLDEALARPIPERLKVVLGTETGMVTSIVRKVQGMLKEAGRDDVEVEIIFPVNSEAVTILGQEASGAISGIPIMPGPAGGEGCSQEGGCASCPYMKMNSLAALMRVCERVGSDAEEAELPAWKPKPYAELINGKSMAQAGCRSILHMRYFQKNKVLSDDLVHDMVTRMG